MGRIGEWKGVGDTMSKKGVVDIHGKQYKTVVLRVNEFRDICNIKDGWGVETCIIELNEKWACVKASITNPEGKVVGTGHGVEFWEGSNKINKSSALENAETSAIGRALAAIGLGGEEYASADEVLNAIKTQKTMEEKEPEAPKAADEPRELGHDIERIREVVRENADKVADKIGKEEALKWHTQMLNNYYRAEKIHEMTSGQLVQYAEQQQERLNQVKE